MRFRTIATLVLFTLLGPAAARAQEGRQKEQQVIDDFVTTRGVIFEEPGKTQQKQPAQAHPRRKGPAPKGSGPNAAASSSSGPGGKAAAASSKSNKGGGAASVNNSGANGPGATAQAEGAGAQALKAGVASGPRPIALGYTILMKDDSGSLSLVESTRVFKTGDRIAVALETNADGYLYMFNASDGRNPELLFPNPQLDAGDNAVQAHARETFPADPSLDFKFTDPPAAEHLFVIFSRRPLAGVPTGEELLRFCGANVEDCAWKPSAQQWERIRTSARLRGVVEAKNAQPAQAAQPVAADTLSRGLKVRREDPKPSVVRVNNAPGADLLVTEIVLTHK